jgi:FdhD protein
VGRKAVRRRIIRVDGTRVSRRPDTLAAEEPLEIRVDGEPLAVTMRTPGDDVDLAIGFLVTEGLVRVGDDVATARFCAGSDDGVNSFNVLDLTLRQGVPPVPVAAQRRFFTSSSCGICGTDSIEAVRKASRHPVADDATSVEPGVVLTLPDRLREGQRVFDRTGGLHAAGLFTARGDLLCLREDVGRHNAVDKVVGWAAREGRLPLSGTVLQVSGRASFELVQKAAMAGIPVLSAVSAPSSLAAELAHDVGMTLLGFVRGASMNVYSGGSRLGLSDDDAQLTVDPTGTP